MGIKQSKGPKWTQPIRAQRPVVDQTAAKPSDNAESRIEGNVDISAGIRTVKEIAGRMLKDHVDSGYFRELGINTMADIATWPSEFKPSEPSSEMSGPGLDIEGDRKPYEPGPQTMTEAGQKIQYLTYLLGLSRHGVALSMEWKYPGQPLKGMLAVGTIHLNRSVEDKRFDNDQPPITWAPDTIARMMGFGNRSRASVFMEETLLRLQKIPGLSRLAGIGLSKLVEGRQPLLSDTGFRGLGQLMNTPLLGGTLIKNVNAGQTVRWSGIPASHSTGESDPHQEHLGIGS
jgi:hypothetical protein